MKEKVRHKRNDGKRGAEDENPMTGNEGKKRRRETEKRRKITKTRKENGGSERNREQPIRKPLSTLLKMSSQNSAALEATGNSLLRKTYQNIRREKERKSKIEEGGKGKERMARGGLEKRGGRRRWK